MKLKFSLEDGVLGSPEWVGGKLLIDIADFSDTLLSGDIKLERTNAYYARQDGDIIEVFSHTSENMWNKVPSHVIWFGDNPWPEWAEKV